MLCALCLYRLASADWKDLLLDGEHLANEPQTSNPSVGQLMGRSTSAEQLGARVSDLRHLLAH